MAQGITIRHAEPADYDAIVDVMDDWWQRPVASILPRLFLDHFYGTSFVALDDDLAVVGFLVGFHSPVRSEESYVHASAVSPNHRSVGLGRRLYRLFFDESLAAGRYVVRAITSPFNAESIAFHRRLGFSVSDVVVDYDGPGVDRLCFRVDLREIE